MIDARVCDWDVPGCQQILLGRRAQVVQSRLLNSPSPFELDFGEVEPDPEDPDLEAFAFCLAPCLELATHVNTLRLSRAQNARLLPIPAGPNCP